MPKPATPIVLSHDERQQLHANRRKSKAQARYVQRGQIILRAAEGMASKEIAAQLRISPAVVSKWRTRFEREGLSGLHDDHRAGRPPTLDEDEFRHRLLAQLDQPAPAGHARWDGQLLARALGVSADRVWRVLRTLGISLKRRRSWCVSTDPQFAEKAADVVGLYLAQPQNAVVLSFDEKPCIQALERAQGWLKLPDGRALTGFAHEYKRHGTSTLFAALNVATRQVKRRPFQTQAARGVFGVHGPAGGNASGQGIACDPRQPEHAPGGAGAVAQGAPSGAFPFHADARLLAQSGGGVV